MDKLDLLHAQGVRVGGKGDPGKWTKSLLPDSMKIEEIDFKYRDDPRCDQGGLGPDRHCFACVK